MQGTFSFMAQPAFSSGYTLAASRLGASERWHVLQSAHYSIVVSPLTPKGTSRNGTSRWWNRWWVRKLRSRQANLSPQGHWLVLQVSGAGRHHSPAAAAGAMPVRGLGTLRLGQQETAGHSPQGHQLPGTDPSLRRPVAVPSQSPLLWSGLQSQNKAFNPSSARGQESWARWVIFAPFVLYPYDHSKFGPVLESCWPQ